MKISEKLSEIKQKEGELHRLYDLRESLVSQNFERTLRGKEDMTSEEIEKKYQEYNDFKVKKIEEVNNKIQDILDIVMEGKNAINRKNIELGVDKKLLKMKYIRIELSKLMRMLKNDTIYNFRASSISLDDPCNTLISEKIKVYEGKKAKLDSEIQSLNWQTELN